MANPGPRARRIGLQEARQELQEDREMRCLTCTTIIEEHEPGPYCWACRTYWEDYAISEAQYEASLFADW